jgi:hypothetical protein
MSTDPTDPPAAAVIPLRAADAPTEVALDEGRPPGPSYIDLTSGDAQRRPLIPEHWRTWENASSTSASPRSGTATGPRITGCGRRPTSSRRSASPCGASSSPPGG